MRLLILTLGIILTLTSCSTSRIINYSTAKNDLTNYESQFTTVDGVEVHYRIEGEGKPLVLIHGFSASLHCWEPLKEELKDEYQIISLDLPGFGLTKMPEVNAAVDLDDFYVTFVDKFLEKIEVDQFYLLGNSMGGWITWQYASEFPQKVEKMILLNAAGYIEDAGAVKSIKFTNSKLFQHFMDKGMPKFLVKQMIKRSFGDDKKIQKSHIERAYQLLNIEGNLQNMRVVANSGVLPDWKKIANIKIPSLIIWGEIDEILSVDDAYRFDQDLTESKLVVYEKVGHAPMIEHTVQTAKDIIEFLGQSDSGLSKVNQ